MLANYYKFEIPEHYLEEIRSLIDGIETHFKEDVDGCLKYQFTQDLKNPSFLYLFTLWKTKEDYEKNLDSEYQVELLDKLIEFKGGIISAEQFLISSHKVVA